MTKPLAHLRAVAAVLLDSMAVVVCGMFAFFGAKMVLVSEASAPLMVALFVVGMAWASGRILMMQFQKKDASK